MVRNNKYSSRSQIGRTNSIRNVRDAILERDNYICVYCGFTADCVDHVVPYSYGGSDEEDNLVASCSICNRMLSDRVFDSVGKKREFVRNRYGPHLASRVKRYKRSLSICGDCGMVYNHLDSDATNVLCGQCYRDDTAWDVYDLRRGEKMNKRDEFKISFDNSITIMGDAIAHAQNRANVV